MKFKYKAIKKSGELVEGVMEGTDIFAIARDVRAQGDTPISATPIKEKAILPFLKSMSFQSKIALRDKIVFITNLSGMLTAGLSLARALLILERQTKNAAFKKILHALGAEIDKGETLSSGMHKYPKVFSSLFVAMVRAGEESGSLSQSLSEVGGMLQKTYALNKKIKGALIYPGVIFSAMILIGVLMLIFVVPTLTKTFQDIGAELPPTTQFVIWLSDTVKNHLLLVALFFLILIGGIIALSKIPRTKRAFDSFVLRLPVIGTIAKEVNAARTARTLSSLLASGVDMSRALTITEEVLQNVRYKACLAEAVTAIEKGLPLSGIFKAHEKLYPIMVGEMTEVGEETGNLSKMLTDIATFYEAEVDAKTKDLSTIIEPVLMIFIGAAVGFFAISMLTPMYSILEDIG